MPPGLLPIVTYHSLNEARSPVAVSPSVFESHLRAFAAAGYRTVALGGALRAIASGAALPENAFAITFDDGYESVVREAWPRLADRGFTASVFLVTGVPHGRAASGPGWKPAERLMNWEQAAALAAAGWELGAHSHTHAPLTILTPAGIETEVQASIEAIRRHTGVGANVFAYPYGAVNDAVRAVVGRHCAVAVTTELGIASRADAPHDLPRIDAWYLRAHDVPVLTSRRYRAWLFARQRARALRRRFVSDWRGEWEQT